MELTEQIKAGIIRIEDSIATCKCGSTVLSKSLRGHIKTKKHIAFIEARREIPASMDEVCKSSISARLQAIQYALLNNKYDIVYKILQSFLVVKPDTCCICMEEKEYFFKCPCCNNTLCVECEYSLITKRCPFCRNIWN